MTHLILQLHLPRFFIALIFIFLPSFCFSIILFESEFRDISPLLSLTSFLLQFVFS